MTPLKRVACSPKQIFPGKFKFKMAGLKIVPLLASVTAQIGAFTALLLQLYGLILLWKINEKQDENAMLTALQTRRNFFL